ncbi:MAG TPA: hypothetical protein VLL08_06375, partial [Kineosporiaceae bacterium]|nr:hypothetical protein [Kineosporiaceae bacterium]
LGADAGVAATSPALRTFRPIAVGVPNLDLIGNNEGGAVDLYLTDGSIQVLTEQKLGLIGEDEGTFDRFGSAVTLADLNGDAYPDLVVGAPGNPVDGSTPGHVDVLLGSALGITDQGATTLPSPAKPGDEFGASVAVSGSTLWIGAPGTDSAGAANSGAVYRYAIDANGKATLQGSTTEATLGASLQANERFGEVLAPAQGGVVVGVPTKNVGSASAAGQIVRLRQSESDAITAEILNQNSTGVPGTAEAGDHFGAAVSVNGYVVGVPGEDVGTLKNAGGVQNFRFGDLGQKMVPSVFQTQDSKGVPGAAEAGDQYGAAVTVGLFDCHEVFSKAVGAPGEDLGKATNAGSVTLSNLEVGNYPCSARVLRQGKGLPGSAETGDAVGSAVGSVNGDSDLEEDRTDVLLVGAPGEDVGTAKAGRDVGRVTTRNAWLGTTQGFGFAGGDRQNLGYGSVFGS